MNYFSSLFIFIFLILLTELIHAQRCNGNEFDYNDKCYHFSQDTKNHQSAEDYCESVGYKLAQIDSDNANTILRIEAQIKYGVNYGSYYIGLSRANSSAKWTWPDQSTPKYLNWAKGEPSSSNNCAVQRISDGNWISFACATSNVYLCEGPLSNETCTYLGTNGWINPATNKCYTFFLNYKTDLFDQCNGSIHSQAEDEFVRDFALSFFYTTGCFDDEQDLVMYHIGTLNGTTGSDSHVWFDGEPFDYYRGNLTYWRLLWGDDYIYVVGIVNPKTRSIEWKQWEDSNFDIVPQSCQYFLCKSDL